MELGVAVVVFALLPLSLASHKVLITITIMSILKPEHWLCIDISEDTFWRRVWETNGGNIYGRWGAEFFVSRSVFLSQTLRAQLNIRCVSFHGKLNIGILSTMNVCCTPSNLNFIHLFIIYTRVAVRHDALQLTKEQVTICFPSGGYWLDASAFWCNF